MEGPLEIRYAGVVIGRAQDVRKVEGDDPSFFIPLRDPMPVGAFLRLRAGDRETPVRVVRAVESADAATCGIQVRTIGEAEEVSEKVSEKVSPEFIPAPAVLAEKVKPAPPTPVGEIREVRMEGMAADSTPAKAAAPAEIPVVSEKPATAEAPEPPQTAADAAQTEAMIVPSGEIAAVPEAVPLAIGSSVTGALKNAAESGSVDVTAPGTEDTSAAVAGEQTTAEDLPPARPIEPSGRRKTRRRR
jgi:hypothetical protein